MLTKVTFYLSDEDRINLDRIRERHPNWPTALIFRRALGVYANNLEKPAPPPANARRSAQQDIEELFGPQL